MCLQPARRCYLQPDGDRGRQGQLAPLCLARQPEKLKLRESLSARPTPAFPTGSVVAEVVVLPLMQIMSSNCPVRSHADLGVSSVCFFFFSCAQVAGEFTSAMLQNFSGLNNIVLAHLFMLHKEPLFLWACVARALWDQMLCFDGPLPHLFHRALPYRI